KQKDSGSRQRPLRCPHVVRDCPERSGPPARQGQQTSRPPDVCRCIFQHDSYTMRRRTPAGDERHPASHSYPIFLRHYALKVFCVPYDCFGMERRDLYCIITEPLPHGSRFSCTSTIISISPGIFIGNCYIPSAELACRPWSQ